MHLKRIILALALLMPVTSGVFFSTAKPKEASAADTIPIAELNTRCGYGYYLGDYTPNKPYTNEYGLFYIGDDDFDKIIDYEITGDKEITFHAPYVFPQVLSTVPGYQRRGFYREYYTQAPALKQKDAWYGIDNPNDQLNINIKDTTVEGLLVGETGNPQAVKGLTFTGVEIDDLTFPVQNLKITFKENIKDYSYLKICLGELSYLSLIDVEESGGVYDELRFPNTRIEKELTTFELYPTSKVNISGTRYSPETQSSWSEVYFGDDGYKSFLNHDKALTKVKSLIREDKITTRAMFDISDGFVLPETTITDFAGRDYTFNQVYPYDSSSFIHGDNYDIVIYPEYSSGGTLTSVKAFKLDDPQIQDYLAEQAEKLVKDKSVFNKEHPSTPYLGNESLIAKDIDPVYGGSLTSNIVFPYSELALGTVNFNKKEANKELDIAKGSIISLPKTISLGEEKDFALLTNPEMNNDSWKKVLSPQGSESFISIWNSLFKTDSYEVDTQRYIKQNDSENIKVQASSNDLTFIRVTKDEEDPKEYEAKTTFNLSENNYATIKEKTPVLLDFSEPGNYKIEFCPRAGNPITKNLQIYDSSSLTPTVNQANNYSLDISIIKPKEEKLLNIAIYKNSNIAKEFTGNTLIEETTVDHEIEQKDFKKLEKDNNNTPISTANLDYLFLNTNNPFSYCYYIELSCLNVTKAYYLYWQHAPVVADIIEVEFMDWPENINWSTTYEVTYKSSSGETPIPESKVYDVISTDPTILSVNKDEQKITAKKEGKVSLIFTNDYGAYFKEDFNIKNDPKNEKKIEVSTDHVSVYENASVELKITACPEAYLDNSKLIINIEDPTIAKYQNGKVTGLKEGTTNLEITYDGEPSLKKTVSIQVSKSGGGDDPDPGPTPGPDPTPDDNSNTNAIILISVVGGAGAIALGIIIFLIIKAKKTGSLKK